MAQLTVYSCDVVQKDLAAYVASVSAAAIKKHDRFTVALSGGSLPAQLSHSLTENKTIDWSKWHVFFADERCVPHNSDDSNYFLAQKEFLDHVPIPEKQIYAIEESAIADPEEAASLYMDTIREVFASRDTVKFPVFDLLLLGMGPDGHTCSLFPDHPLLDETVNWVASITDSPKPPPSRITLTFPVLNHAHNVAFVCTGEGKQEALHRIFDKKESLPAGRVNPVSGQVVWFLDEAAAKGIQGGVTISKYAKL